MRYYISKPKSHKTDENIIYGVKKMDSNAILVDSVSDADICVFQKGWTKSQTCVAEYHLARDLRIERKEGYLYTDAYVAKLNCKGE